MEPPVRIDEVWKTFGSTAAVCGLSLSVPAQSAYGFLGPNGAGKSTTIRMMLGLQRPNRGHSFSVWPSAGGGSNCSARPYRLAGGVDSALSRNHRQTHVSQRLRAAGYLPTDTVNPRLLNPYIDPRRLLSRLEVDRPRPRLID